MGKIESFYKKHLSNTIHETIAQNEPNRLVDFRGTLSI